MAEVTFSPLDSEEQKVKHEPIPEAPKGPEQPSGFSGAIEKAGRKLQTLASLAPQPVKDVALGLGQFGIGAGQTAFSLADIASQGQLNKAYRGALGENYYTDVAQAQSAAQAAQSPEAQASNRALAEGVQNADIGKILESVSTPTGALTQLAQQGPYVALGGALTKGLGAIAGQAAPIASEALIGAASAGGQAKQSVYQDENLQNQQAYKDLIAKGYTDNEARDAIANTAGNVAAAIAAPLSAASNKLSGASAVENRLFNNAERIVPKPGEVVPGYGAQIAQGTLKGLATEIPQEFVQEGSEQFGQNVGAKVSGQNPNQSLSDQVLGSALAGGVLAAGPGAAIGGLGPAINPRGEYRARLPDGTYTTDRAKVEEAVNEIASQASPQNREEVARAARAKMYSDALYGQGQPAVKPSISGEFISGQTTNGSSGRFSGVTIDQNGIQNIQTGQNADIVPLVNQGTLFDQAQIGQQRAALDRPLIEGQLAEDQNTTQSQAPSSPLNPPALIQQQPITEGQQNAEAIRNDQTSIGEQRKIGQDGQTDSGGNIRIQGQEQGGTQQQGQAPQGGVTYSRGGYAKGSKSADLEQELNKTVGPGFSKLLDNGSVVIHENESDLPQHLQHPDGGVNAVYDRETGVTHIVAGNISPGEGLGIVAHEIGVHAGFKGVVDNKTFTKIRNEAIKRIEEGDHELAKALSNTPWDTKPEDFTEEAIAYLVQNRPKLAITKSIIAKIRAGLVRRGFTKAANSDAIIQLANGALQKIIDGAQGNIGQGKSYTFGGIKAKTADTEAAVFANDALNAGFNPEKVRETTGWHKGRDGQLRFEIDDSKFSTTWNKSPTAIIDRFSDERSSYNTPSAPFETVFKHAALLDAYPFVRNVRIAVLPNTPEFQKTLGAYDKTDNTLYISGKSSAEEQKKTAIHEIQHLIQQHEGFAPGGNLDTESRYVKNLNEAASKLEQAAKSGDEQAQKRLDAVNKLKGQATNARVVYHKLAGEVEARNTQERLNLTAEQRKELSPAATQDVRTRDQIIHYYSGAPSRLYSRKAQVSWEARPSTKIDFMSGIHEAPLDQVVSYQKDISNALSPNGTDVIAKALGLIEKGSLLGPGAWESKVSAGGQKLFDAKGNKIPEETRRKLDTYSAIVGLLLKQDAVAWHAPFYTKDVSKANGVEVDTGKPITYEEADKIYAEMRRITGRDDLVPITYEKGFRVLNFTDTPNSEFHKQVQQATDNVFADANRTPRMRGFASDGNLVENDWRKSGGEEYLARIKETDRPESVQQAIRDVYPRIDKVNSEYIKKYGWNEGKEESVAKDLGDFAYSRRANTEFKYPVGEPVVKKIAEEIGASYNVTEMSGKSIAKVAFDTSDPGAIEKIKSNKFVKAVTDEEAPTTAGGRGPEPTVDPRGHTEDSRQKGLEGYHKPEGQAWRLREQQPDAVAVSGWHYSNTADLKTLDSGKAGTGSTGTERNRFGSGQAEGKNNPLAYRTYFYLEQNGRPEPEPVVRGQHVYQTNLSNMYDFKEDPRGILQSLRDKGIRNDPQALEQAVVAAGFDGYVVQDDQWGSAGAGVILGKAEIPVTYKGSKFSPDKLYSRNWKKILEDANKPLNKKDQKAVIDLANKAQIANVIDGKEKIPGLKEKNSVVDVAKALDARAPHQVNNLDAFDHEYLAQTLLHEVKYQLGRDDSAIGWYEGKVKAAMDEVGSLFPEVLSDKNKGSMFKAILAITSNGTDVENNMKNAISIYGEYRETGKIDFNRKFSGTRAKEISSTLQALQELIDSQGESSVREFLDKEMTVKEMRNSGLAIVSGEPADFKIRGAMFFGPKLGSFYGNLNGLFDTLTMDLWWSRTFGRVSGHMIRENPENTKRARETLRNIIRNGTAEDFTYGHNMKEALKSDSALDAYAASVKSKATLQSERENMPDSLRRSANNLTESLNATADSPLGPTDRMWQRSVTKRLQDLLREEGKDITTADIQALLWYHEKQLYSELGATQQRAEPTDYEQAARKATREYRSNRTDIGRDGGRGVRESSGVAQPSEGETKGNVQYSRNWKDGLNQQQRDAVDKIGSPKADSFIDRVKVSTRKFLDSWRQGIVDQYDSLKRLDESVHAKGIHNTSARLSSWVLARMSSNDTGGIEALLFDGKPFLNGGALDVNTVGKGLIDALKPLSGEVDRFLAWIAGNRSESLALAGKENLFTPQDIQALKTLNQGKMEDGRSRSQVYNDVWKEFNEFNKAVLAIGTRTGVISPEFKKVWENEFYVPFYRVIDNEQRGPKTLAGLTRQQAYKALKGGKENLSDLLGNTLMNWQHIISAGLKNQAGVQAIDNGIKAGIVTKVNSNTKDAIFVMRGGQKHYYTVSDPLVLEAISALSYEGLNNVAMRGLRAFKRAFTHVVTIDPAFTIANLMRDQLSAIATSKLSPWTGGFGNIARGIKELNKNSISRARMTAGGGMMSFGHVYGSDPDAVKAFLDKSLKGHLVTPENAIGIVRKLWEFYGGIRSKSENANRAALYKQMIDQGSSHLMASFHARDLMDFGAHGAWPAVRFLTQITPFLNARIQGLDKLGRSMADPHQRAQFWAVTGAIALASAMLYLGYKDDEDYKKREEWDRDTYWWFKIGDQQYRIPKPFEIGSIGTMVERGIEQIVDDKVHGKLFLERFLATLTNTFALNPIPQAVLPAVELFANKSTFTGRPIEPAQFEKMSPEEKKQAWTSQTAISLADGYDKIAWDSVKLSPLQVEHLIRGYFGWVGSISMGIADQVLRPISGAPEQPTAKISQYPGIGRFLRDNIPSHTKYDTLFYDELNAANRAYADVQHYRSIGDMAKAAELYEKNKDTLKKRDLLVKAQGQLSKLSQRSKMIYANQGLSAEEKRQQLDRISELRNRLTEQVVEKVQ